MFGFEERSRQEGEGKDAHDPTPGFVEIWQNMSQPGSLGKAKSEGVQWSNGAYKPEPLRRVKISANT